MVMCWTCRYHESLTGKCPLVYVLHLYKTLWLECHMNKCQHVYPRVLSSLHLMVSSLENRTRASVVNLLAAAMDLNRNSLPEALVALSYHCRLFNQNEATERKLAIMQKGKLLNLWEILGMVSTLQNRGEETLFFYGWGPGGGGS